MNNFTERKNQRKLAEVRNASAQAKTHGANVSRVKPTLPMRPTNAPWNI